MENREQCVINSGRGEQERKEKTGKGTNVDVLLLRTWM